MVRPRALVVCAFEPEIAPLRRLTAGLTGLRLQPVGIGAVDAAAGAARAIAAHRPRRVLFVGTAGVYARAPIPVPIGAAVVPAAIHCVSTAALAGNGYLPAPMVIQAAASRKLAAALAGGAGAAVAELPAVACPIAITRSSALARRIVSATGASLENLELFAVARAADAAGLEFAAVLGVANAVGPTAHQEWLANHRRASRAACDLVARWARQDLDEAEIRKSRKFR